MLGIESSRYCLILLFLSISARARLTIPSASAMTSFPRRHVYKATPSPSNCSCARANLLLHSSNFLFTACGPSVGEPAVDVLPSDRYPDPAEPNDGGGFDDGGGSGS